MTGKILIENNFKIEKIKEDSLDSISSPSVKIQIMGRKVSLSCKGKTLLGGVNKLLKTKSLLTSPSNVLPYYPKETFEFSLKVKESNPGYLQSYIYQVL